MVAQVIRNIFSDKLSTKYQGIVQNLANKAPIPIRHFDFKFNPAELDQKFFLNKELATSYFHALSIFLTFGEDVVIETARHHREFINDPILKQRLTSLIGQEAIHSKIHNQFNDEVLKENGYPVELLRAIADKVFEYGFINYRTLCSYL